MSGSLDSGPDLGSCDGDAVLDLLQQGPEVLATVKLARHCFLWSDDAYEGSMYELPSNRFRLQRKGGGGDVTIFDKELDVDAAGEDQARQCSVDTTWSCEQYPNTACEDCAEDDEDCHKYCDAECVDCNGDGTKECDIAGRDRACAALLVYQEKDACAPAGPQEYVLSAWDRFAEPEEWRAEATRQLEVQAHGDSCATGGGDEGDEGCAVASGRSTAVPLALLLLLVGGVALARSRRSG